MYGKESISRKYLSSFLRIGIVLMKIVIVLIDL